MISTPPMPDVPSWLAALMDRYPLPERLRAEAADHATLEAAWDGDDPALLIWLAARLAPTLDDSQAVLATAAQLVEQRFRHIDAGDLDLSALVALTPGIAENRFDRPALGHAMGAATVHSLVASGMHHLLAAAIHLETAKATKAADVVLSRRVPWLLASAVQDASAAFSNSIPVFGVLGGGDELVRARHALIDGQVRFRTTS